MRILVDQGGYELLNMGDVAMLQSCVQRLTQQWPAADIMVIARAGSDLPVYCPGTSMVERASGRRFARLLPGRYRPVWYSVTPYLSGWPGSGWAPRSQPLTALQAVRAADLVVAAGGGYITDTWRWHATGVLGTLSLAQRLGKPTAMFGQGIGPVRQRMLRVQARAVLPKLRILGLREGGMSRDLALSLGARPEALTITGDDAMELTQSDRATDGHALGINIRVSGYAGVDSATAAAVGHVVGQSAASFQAPIAALPVSRSGADADLTVISQMLSHGDHPADVTMRDLSAPRDLAAETANCRAIVTGSYHAAVFGLGQGVPTVCVTKSSYYDGKFNGLRALFPESCFVISLTSPGFSDRLRAAIDQAWHLPASSRAQASEAAARQREAGRAAYAKFRMLVEETSSVLHATPR